MNVSFTRTDFYLLSSPTFPAEELFRCLELNEYSFRVTKNSHQGVSARKELEMDVKNESDNEKGLKWRVISGFTSIGLERGEQEWTSLWSLQKVLNERK